MLVESTPEVRNTRDWECQQFSMQAYKTNLLICGMFMSSSMKGAIRLGPNYLANSEIYKNTKFDEIESLFNITRKLVMELSEEILNVKCLEYSSPSWARSILSHDQAIKWAKAISTCLCSFRSMCGTDEGQSRSDRKRERSSGRTQDAVGIDGEAIIIVYSSRDPKDLMRKNIQPGEFKDQIIFMPMFNELSVKQYVVIVEAKDNTSVGTCFD